MKNKKEQSTARSEFCAQFIGGNPEDCEEMVMKYGTYNIQPTADADNVYPTIAQGLPKEGYISEE